MTMTSMNPTFKNAIYDEKYSVETTLHRKEYKSHQQIGRALQGFVYKSSKDKQTFVIKIISKSLYDNKITYHQIEVHEDILKEAQILKYLTNNDPPLSLTKYVDFFEDQNNYFLVMENGGDSLFLFVKQCHEFIQKGFMELNVWRSFVKDAMLQIVSLIYWMHNTMHCCHLDISLENFVIQNVNITTLNDGTNKILQFNDFQIKIIDFGLAEVFSKRNKGGDIDFEYNKYVGKKTYKSPEVYRRRGAFDARSADCWSLGVCFFMMSVGSPPFRRAFPDDALYTSIVINGDLERVLHSWNKGEYVTCDILDLMRRIFVKEEHRLNIKQIRKHSYFNCL